MQAIELAVFLIVSVVIAGMVLLFVGNINPAELYESINSMIFPQPFDPGTLNRVTGEEFPGLLGKCWANCEFGATPKSCGSVYITGSEGATITKNGIDMVFNKYNYCTDCNIALYREGMPDAMLPDDPINLPSIVDVNCSATGLRVIGA